MEVANNASLDINKLQNILVGKAYHLYENRNEWVDWNGDTAMVSRSRRTVELSLDNAKQLAEKWRIQGSYFIIDELPIICLQASSESRIITELFSEYPLEDCLNQPIQYSKINSINRLGIALATSEWAESIAKNGSPQIAPIDGIYYRRTSSPGKGNNSLVWNLKPRTINDYAVKKIANEINQSLTQTCT